MTLCVAALCHESGSPRVVMCFDRKGSAPQGSAETLFKYETLTSSAAVLLAGDDVSLLRELSALYRGHLEANPPPRGLDKMLAYLREPAKEFRRRERSSYISAVLGKSLEEVEAELKVSPKNKEYRDIVSQSITNSSYWSMLLTFWAGRRFRIFECTNGIVSQCENYGCIGSGAQVAAAMLQYRQQADYDTLSSALYKLYEAKRLSEIVDSVGSATDILVFSYDTNEQCVMLSGLKNDGMEYLKRQFSEYGPRDFPMRHDFPETLFNGYIPLIPASQ